MPRIRKPKPLIIPTGNLLIGTVSDNTSNLGVWGSINTSNIQPASITFSDTTAQEVLKISNNGDLYWRGRLIETDAELKSAMVDLHSVLCIRR